ncbi:hypothetical protein C7S17_7253 [Burkholderia thailandensis]|nr:hypothetical protein [Burkholderia thailandensis]
MISMRLARCSSGGTTTTVSPSTVCTAERGVAGVAAGHAGAGGA